MPNQKLWFADRIYIHEEVDITPLCLAIIAPISPGNPDFEEVLNELKRCRNGRIMRKKWAQLLRSWIKEFQTGCRNSNVRLNKRYSSPPPVSDSHFVESMFRSFSHQFTVAGHRIGKLECENLSIKLIAMGSSGTSPFSRTWANANAIERRKIRQITHLMREQETEDTR
jgi:hypothetical protein